MCNTECVQEVGMTKNITLRMDEQLLKDVKHIAVEEDMSVSAWINQLVEKATRKDVRYEEGSVKSSMKMPMAMRPSDADPRSGSKEGF